MSNTTTATFAAGQTEAVADTRLLQWAYGQVLRLEGLELPTSYQVDFSNTEYCGASVPKMGNSEGVQIPNKLLSTGLNVYAFVWLIDANGGRTQYRVTIPVTPRPAPELPDPSPEEDSAIAEAIEALNSAVDQAEASAADAAESAAEAAGVKDQLIARIDATDAALAAETTARENAVTAEADARTAADTALAGSVAPAFSTETDYRVNNYVLYNGAVYRFKADHPAGTWASGDVEAATAASGWNDLVPFVLAQSKTKALIGTAEAHIDLNDITAVGNYRITSLAYAKLVDNLPGDSPQAGRLTVMLTTSGQITQFYIMQISTGNIIYYRNKYGANWTPWQKILTDLRMDAVPTANSTYPVSSGGVYEAINSITAAEGDAW